jgi:hypothetical protein
MTMEERIEQLEGDVAALRQELAHEKTERAALAKIIVPELTETRTNLELNVTYFTQRLEALQARAAASGADDVVADDIAELYEGLLSLLKIANATSGRIDWLQGLVQRELHRQARLAGVEAA